MTHADLRVLWTVIGLLLVAVGTFGVVAGLGYVGGVDPEAPLLWSGLLGLWHDTAPTGLVVLLALGLLLALLGLRLLNRQLRPRPEPLMGELPLPDSMAVVSGTDGAALDAMDLPGRTTVRGAVLARGLERDLTRDPAVREASVVLAGEVTRPELLIRLHLGPHARLDTVHEHVGSAVARFSATTGLCPRYLDVTARVAPTGFSRVR